MQDKNNLVRKIFSAVANRYDLMNDLMSFGIHRFWKKKFIEIFSNYSGSLLDMAGGTCDIAMQYYQKAKIQGHIPQIIACDINYQMLEVGRNKVIDHNILSGINVITADAERLPFLDNSFDNYTIAFGIRNVNNIELVLNEAYRVLKPGGRFACLEFSHPDNEHFAKIYDLYSFKVIPLIGKIFANNQDAYQYLVDSIRSFPKQEAFCNMLVKANFQQVSFNNLTASIVAIHQGYKII